MGILSLRDVFFVSRKFNHLRKLRISLSSGVLMIAGLLGLSLIDIRPGALEPYVMAVAVVLPVVGGLVRFFSGGFRGVSGTVFAVVMLAAGMLLTWWLGWRYFLWAGGSLGCLIIGLWSSLRAEQESKRNGRQLATWLLFLVVALGAWGYLHQAARFGLFPYQRGLWVKYYPGGKIQQQARYHLGVLDGEYRENFPTGRVSFEGIYRHGQREGLFITHSPSGKRLSEAVYKDGRLSELTQYFYLTYGHHTWWWRTDEPNKKRHEFWHENGHTLYKETYVDDYLFSYRHYVAGEFIEVLWD
jgi:hypothetical protein